LRPRGSKRVRLIETASSTKIAMKKRIATNEIGGRSRNPIFIASQVELHTMQSVSHANGTPHPAFGRHFSSSDTLVVFTRARASRVGYDS
jgi:hypothetical protein